MKDERTDTEENDRQDREEIEQAILRSWVGGKTELLDPYHELTGKDHYYFRWAESEDGAIVTFKPRMISMKVMMSWLNATGVIDIQQSRQSSFAAQMMGNKVAEINEVSILLSKA